MTFLLAVWSALAVWFFSAHGWILYYGDAEAHLNRARELIDSRTPGYNELGTVWLPLLHLLTLPFVRVDALWRNGLAGAIPAAACFVLAGSFLFAAVRRAFDSRAAAFAAVALFALNPNILYLQSIPMTESVFFACLMALLYFTVRFRDTQGWGAVAGAGMAACLATLTRYDAWFLVPFAAAYLLFIAERRRFAVAFVFCLLACLGPAWWLAHNWWMTGDALDFYRGPYSPRAIQRNLPYPGKGNWREAFLYYRTAVQLCAGPGLALMAMAGVVVALLRRAFWPVLLLALPGIFYIWSMHSSGGTPIFVPDLPPYSYYNTRYGTAVLPLLAFAAAALVMAVPDRLRVPIAALIIVAGTVHWAAHPASSAWVTWEESRRNSEGRRAWTAEAAAFLQPRYRTGSGIITSFGDMTGIWREMGVPLRQTFTGDNGIAFDATVARPDLHLRQEWAVCMGGDPVQTAINRAARYGIRYDLLKTIVKDKEPVIEIYRRIGDQHGIP